ncbi:hypothetical protein [Borrelia puertoricensis]|uniref:hypothetical protein n=1 Tax=Borrelia puertoricensis TaxID=2756107 RepID=UPI001FF485C0|nr:hypothetical protein [Borrelia puertoricensis]
MFLNPPSSPSGPPPLIENDPEEKVFESIKKCVMSIDIEIKTKSYRMRFLRLA